RTDGISSRPDEGSVQADSRHTGFALQVESKAGSRNPDPTATDQCASPAGTETTALQQYRSSSISLALSLVSLRPWRDCDCQAGDDHSLAPRWVSSVLALAIAQPCWQTEGLDCAAHAHWRDEPGEPALGRPTHSWRTAQAWLRGRSVDSRSVYVPPLAATISRLAHVFKQPCRRHRGGRPFCPSNDRVPDPLLPCHSASWTTGLGVVWGNGKSNCGVDLAPDHRGFPMGPGAAIPHSGSGHVVRASLRAASARHGYSRSADCVPITLAKRLR